MNDATNDDPNGTRNAQTMTPTAQVKILDDGQLKTLALVIEQAPPPPKKMKVADALNALSPQLRDAVQRGHNAESLTSLLNHHGLNVSKRMLARLMRDLSPKIRTKAPNSRASSAKQIAG